MEQRTIRNFRELDTNNPYFSKAFTVRNCDWEFAVYRGKEGKEDYLGIYLHVADALNLAKGWSIKAEFTFTVVNQSSREKSKTTRVMRHKFCEREVKCGSSRIMRLDELEGRKKGFIHDNKCIVAVEFNVVKPAGLVDIKHLDFAGIERPFVHLLKDVFSCHRSLLDFKQNQIPKDKVRPFNDLGRVLKFLREKEWKDMKDMTSRKDLRNWWWKLKESGLDLRWLEPKVTSALNIEEYLKKEDEVTKLNEKLKKLKKEKEELMEKLRGKKENVEMTTKDLEKAKQGFKKKDLNEKIGYPLPRN